MGLKFLSNIGLLLKAGKVLSESEKAKKEGTLNQSLRGLLHILALAAPIAGATLLDQVGVLLGHSDDHLLQALGAFLGALIPLVRRFGNPADRGTGTPQV